MKLVSGHKYLRGANGEVVPYNEGLAKASGYEQFTQEGDFENEMQLPENQRIVARKAIPVTKQGAKPPVFTKAALQAKPAQSVKPAPKGSFVDGHMDIRQDMAADLSGLE